MFHTVSTAVSTTSAEEDNFRYNEEEESLSRTGAGFVHSNDDAELDISSDVTQSLAAHCYSENTNDQTACAHQTECNEHENTPSLTVESPGSPANESTASYTDPLVTTPYFSPDEADDFSESTDRCINMESGMQTAAELFPFKDDRDFLRKDASKSTTNSFTVVKHKKVELAPTTFVAPRNNDNSKGNLWIVFNFIVIPNLLVLREPNVRQLFAIRAFWKREISSMIFENSEFVIRYQTNTHLPFECCTFTRTYQTNA